jgi:hypothetical protein
VSRNFWDQESPGVSDFDSDRDSQEDGQGRTTADDHGIWELALELQWTLMDSHGRWTRGLQNRGECEGLARVFICTSMYVAACIVGGSTVGKGGRRFAAVACTSSCSNSAED